MKADNGYMHSRKCILCIKTLHKNRLSTALVAVIGIMKHTLHKMHIFCILYTKTVA